MGESQTPHFYDLMIFGCVQTLQNHLCSSLETPGHLTKIKKARWEMFQNIIAGFLEDGHRQIPKIRLVQSWRS